MKKTTALTIIILMIINTSLLAQKTNHGSDQREAFRNLKSELISPDENHQQYHALFKSGAAVCEDYGEVPETDWFKKFGGSGADYIQKVFGDESGNLYLIGDFSGTMEFAGQELSSVGRRDIFIAKMDGSGNLVWIKQGNCGEDNSTTLYDMELTETHLVITGYFRGADFYMDGSSLNLTGISDALLIKISLDGQISLLTSISNNGFPLMGMALTVDSDQNIYIAGTLDGSTYYVHPSFLTKLNQNGETLWWQQHEIAFNDLAISGNSLFVAGTAYQDAWLGNIMLDPGTYGDAFVSKASLEGIYDWAIIGEHDQVPIGDSYLPKIETGSTGDIFMAGYFRNHVEFGGISLDELMTNVFVLRIDEAGNVSWAKSCKTGDRLNSLGLLSDDMICISGPMGHTATFDDIEINGSTGYYAAIYNSSGEAQYAFPVDQEVLGISSIYEENFLMAGTITMNAALMQYDFSGTAQIVAAGSGNSGTAELTGMEVNEEGVVFSLSNVYGHTDYFGLELFNKNPSMLLAAHGPGSELIWTETIEGGEAWWNFTETNLKLDDEHNRLYLHGSWEDTLKIGGLEFFAPSRAYFLAAYDENGDFLWIIDYPYENGINVQSVDVDAMGNVFCVFNFSGILEIGGQTFESINTGSALAAKYTMAGDFISAVQFSTDQFFYQIGIAPILTGGYFVTLEPAGDTVFFDNGNNNMILTPNDGRCVVAKYDDQNNYLWAKSYGYSPKSYGGYYCWPTASVSDADGNLYITGTHGDSAMFDDIMIRTPYYRYSPFNAKIDGDGNTLWANSIQSHQWGNNYCEADIDNEGSFYCMGDINDTIHFGDWQYVPAGTRDFYIAKYTSMGEVSWVKTFQSSSSINHLMGLAVFDIDNVFAGGRFSNSLLCDADNSLKTTSSKAGMMVHLGDSIAYTTINERAETEIFVTVYPNPASRELHLNFKNPATKTSLEMLDLNGRRIFTNKMNNVSGTQTMVLPELPGGAYMLKISADKKTATRKILIR